MAVKKTKRKTVSKATAKAPSKAARKPAKKPAAKQATKQAAPKRAAKPKAATKPKAASRPAAPVKKVWLHPPVVHWEIAAIDAVKQRGFFSDLFGWSIDANNPQNYGMVASAGDGAIGGGIGGAVDGKASVTFYVEVPDINAALAKAESLGAITVMPRMDIGMVVLGQFRDPEGNVVGLIESR